MSQVHGDTTPQAVVCAHGFRSLQYRTHVYTELIVQVARALNQAQRVLFITGAGMSADSGLPTYRGIGGLYNQGDTDDGLPIEVMLSGDMMRQRPASCWKYLAQIELACRGATPNRGHELLVEWERTLPHACLLTQNVDGFHRQAGSANVIDIHGDIHDLYCVQCDHQERVDDFSHLSVPPACPVCSSLVRPHVVLFGELLSGVHVRSLEQEMARGFDVVLSIGTTSVFPYIAGPVLEVRDRGGLTVEINPGDTAVSEVVDVRLKGTATEMLGALAAARAGRSSGA